MLLIFFVYSLNWKNKLVRYCQPLQYKVDPCLLQKHTKNKKWTWIKKSPVWHRSRGTLSTAVEPALWLAHAQLRHTPGESTPSKSFGLNTFLTARSSRASDIAVSRVFCAESLNFFSRVEKPVNIQKKRRNIFFFRKHPWA